MRYRKNMAAREDHTMCLRCLHALSRKAPFDPDGSCAKCKRIMAPRQSIMPDIYYKCALVHAIFTEVMRRRNNAYAAHGIVKCTIPNIPLDFMKRFMAEGAGKGRLESSRAYDKEGLHVLGKDFKDSKA